MRNKSLPGLKQLPCGGIDVCMCSPLKHSEEEHKAEHDKEKSLISKTLKKFQKKKFSIFLQKELVNFFTKSNVLKKNALCLSKTLILNEKQTEGADFACFCSLFSH